MTTWNQKLEERMREIAHEEQTELRELIEEILSEVPVPPVDPPPPPPPPEPPPPPPPSGQVVYEPDLGDDASYEQNKLKGWTHRRSPSQSKGMERVGDRCRLWFQPHNKYILQLEQPVRDCRLTVRYTVPSEVWKDGPALGGGHLIQLSNTSVPFLPLDGIKAEGWMRADVGAAIAERGRFSRMHLDAYRNARGASSAGNQTARVGSVMRGPQSAFEFGREHEMMMEFRFIDEIPGECHIKVTVDGHTMVVQEYPLNVTGNVNEPFRQIQIGNMDKLRPNDKAYIDLSLIRLEAL